jgi:hypothetical protein
MTAAAKVFVPNGYRAMAPEPEPDPDEDPELDPEVEVAEEVDSEAGVVDGEFVEKVGVAGQYSPFSQHPLPAQLEKRKSQSLLYLQEDDWAAYY